MADKSKGVGKWEAAPIVLPSPGLERVQVKAKVMVVNLGNQGNMPGYWVGSDVGEKQKKIYYR